MVYVEPLRNLDTAYPQKGERGMAGNKSTGGGKPKKKAVVLKRIAGSALSQTGSDRKGSKARIKGEDTHRPPQSDPPKKKYKK